MKNISYEDFKLYLALYPFLKFQDIHLILKNSFNKPYINLSSSELIKLGFRQEIISDFILWQIKFNFTYLKNKLELEKIKLLCCSDEIHINIFKEIYCPPPFLFYQGNLNILNQKNVLFLAVVGSRKNSKHGEKVVEKIIKDLSDNIEIVTISGLARGIDTHVHLESLKTQVPTIAVLGSGLFTDKIYPKENIFLAKSIVDNGGLLLSEFPPYAPPRKEHFPRRNRIISALSRAVLVIEAGKKSGALITARHALEQNKDVFAIPGNIFLDEYIGNNRLIQDGAYPILDYEDIIKYFN